MKSKRGVPQKKRKYRDEIYNVFSINWLFGSEEKKTKSRELLAETSLYHNFKSRDKRTKKKGDTNVKEKVPWPVSNITECGFFPPFLEMYGGSR